MKERIYMASPTMHGEEQKFVQEAFDTNWIAHLGQMSMALNVRWKRIQESHTAVH